MTLIVKNRKLRNKIYKSMNRYDKIALSFYKRGKIVKGKKYENKSFRLYKKNYKKMFKVRR